jgi:hypothetical protein
LFKIEDNLEEDIDDLTEHTEDGEWALVEDVF